MPLRQIVGDEAEEGDFEMVQENASLLSQTRSERVSAGAGEALPFDAWSTSSSSSLSLQM
jgi:hypothetical protein